MNVKMLPCKKIINILSCAVSKHPWNRINLASKIFRYPKRQNYWLTSCSLQFQTSPPVTNAERLTRPIEVFKWAERTPGSWKWEERWERLLSVDALDGKTTLIFSRWAQRDSKRRRLLLREAIYCDVRCICLCMFCLRLYEYFMSPSKQKVQLLEVWEKIHTWSLLVWLLTFWFKEIVHAEMIILSSFIVVPNLHYFILWKKWK